MSRLAVHWFCVYLFWSVSLSSYAQGRPQRVELAEITARTVARIDQVSGRLTLTRPHLVSARVAGVVQSLSVEPGELVKAGELLLTLSTPAADDQSVQIELDIELDNSRLRELANELKRERDALKIAKAQAELVGKQSQRTASLSSHLSQEVKETAMGNKLSADLRVIEREASIRQLNERRRQLDLSLQKKQSQLEALNRDRATRIVTSEVAGYVDQLSARPGEPVDTDQILLHVLPLSSLVGEIAVAPRQVELIRASETVQVKINEQRFGARFHSALPTLDSHSGLQSVFLGFENAERVPFVLNLPLVASVPLEAGRASLVIPQDAIVPRGQRTFLFIADGERARQVEVQLGTVMGDLVSIEGTVAAGDKVVVRGNETLLDGQRITTGRGGKATGGKNKRDDAEAPSADAEGQQGESSTRRNTNPSKRKDSAGS